MTPDESRTGSLDGLRVMVIDDSKTIRRTAETLLKREGADVVTATDGFEALAKIADQQPQIIFVDIMMPRLDGYQTCTRTLRNVGSTRSGTMTKDSRDSNQESGKRHDAKNREAPSWTCTFCHPPELPLHSNDQKPSQYQNREYDEHIAPTQVFQMFPRDNVLAHLPPRLSNRQARRSELLVP